VQVYGHRSFELDLPRFLRDFTARLEHAPTALPHDDLVEWLVDFAEAESAVADAWCVDADDEVPSLDPWRDALGALADLFCASAAGLPTPGERLEILRRSVPALPVPQATVHARAAEGFACYALYPEQYVDAARQHVADAGERPITCIGIRSIGSVLAAVCASTFRGAGKQVELRTVRPRGHPFDRTLTLGPDLRRVLASRSGSSFVIVDEGPGISGSSFAAVVDWLVDAGVPHERITLIPSWKCPALTLRSGRARAAFTQCRVIVGTPRAEAHARRALGGCAIEDQSAGRWRTRLFASNTLWPAVQPQHERVKYTASSRSLPVLARFAGLGRQGRAKLARATALEEGGFGPRPIRCSNGFLVREWVEGRVLTPELVTGTVVKQIAAYLSFLSRAFALGEADDGEDLAAMLRQNTVEGLGGDSAAAVERLIDRRPDADRPRVAVDGRLLAHEWIVPLDQRGPLLKVDALDHHADDFLPGCRDIAWDVAGACVELAFAPGARDLLLTQYARLAGDRTIAERLPFFEASYVAYRLGYATLAAESLDGSPDGRRFMELRERYRRLLAARVALPRPAAAR
jgi:hypothetical protein